MVSVSSMLLLGAIAMGNVVAGIFFLRYWRGSRDRFFLLFALSFFVQAFNRIALALSDNPSDGSPWHYSVRLVAYLLIIVAVLDKNRAPRTTRGPNLR